MIESRLVKFVNSSKFVFKFTKNWHLAQSAKIELINSILKSSIFFKKETTIILFTLILSTTFASKKCKIFKPDNE